jgi:hypothetical protein
MTTSHCICYDVVISLGEQITGESWILTNIMQKVKPRYSHRIGLAKYPNSSKAQESKD